MYVGATPTTGDFKKLDSITTSSSTTFNLRQGGVAVYPQSANHCIVSLNGVIQAPVDAFTIVNDTIVFASSLASSDVINFILVLGNVNDIGVVSDDTISAAKIQTDAVTQAKIADEAIDEARMQISNAGSNGQFLSKQSGNTGGLTWAAAGGAADDYFASSGLSAKDLGEGLHIKTGDSGASVSTDSDHIVLESDSGVGMTMAGGTGNDMAIDFADSGGSQRGRFIYAHNGDNMMFHTAGAERMRIESGGKQKYNTTADFGGTWFHYRGTFNANRGLGINSTDGTSGVPMIYFGVQDSAQGDINAGGGSVTYNTSSDYRRKENVKDFVNGIDKVKQLKVYTFNFIDDPDKINKGGFFAHEVDGIVSEAVSGDKDEVQKYKENQDIPEGKSVGDNILDEEGNTIPEYQRIDHSKMIPVLTKALQESITKIETLETEMTALKARVKTLEDA